MTRPSHAALVEEVAQLCISANAREDGLGYGDRERARSHVGPSRLIACPISAT